MIEVELKNNDGQFRTTLAKGEANAVIVFYLKEKSISMDCVGVNNVDFLKELKKQLPKVIDNAIKEQTGDKNLKVKKGE